MKKRMSKTSLAAHENVKPKKENQRAIIEKALRLAEGYPMTAKFIAAKTGLKLESVNGRINEMLYKYQTVKIVSVINDCQGYALRLESDPLNVRPESKVERLEKEVRELTSFITELKKKVELYTGEKVQITHINCDLNHK